MENQITLSAHKIIDKFMKYAWNFSSVKIGNHYAPECLKATTVPEHLAEKFTYYAETEKSGTQGFLKLWHELDGENQELVTEWLIENYNG